MTESLERPPMDPAYRSPVWLRMLMNLFAVLLYAGIVYTAQAGLWLACGALAFFVAYVPNLALRVGFDRNEDGSRVTARQVLNPKVQSAAWLASGGLAIAITAGAYGLQGWAHTCWWPVAVFLVVGLAMYAWWVKADKPNFVRDGAEALLHSYAKLAFDRITLRDLPAAFVGIAGPLIFSDQWLHSVTPEVALLGLAIWIAGARRDAQGPPKPFDIYTAFNYELGESDPHYRVPPISEG